MKRALIFAVFPAVMAGQPVFHKDVEPLLEKHCQGCHHAGGSAPMPLVTFPQTRPWAKAIQKAVLEKSMPPWFADPRYGKFSNDPTLSAVEIATVDAWVRGGSLEGSAKDAPAPVTWNSSWLIGKPDLIVSMPVAFALPKVGEVEYQYMIVPLNLASDRWVEKVEILPGNRAAVHHAVVYLRERGANWLKDRPRGAFFTLGTEEPDSFTTSDILATYTPGAAADQWPRGMAKLIKAGSELVFQMHYTAGKGSDQTRLGIVFSKEPPAKRVVTLQLNNDKILIPPGVPDYRLTTWGTLPNDALLLSFFPHMHWRGKEFEYRAGSTVLLRVNHYDFRWQLTYRLQEPLQLKAGTRLESTAVYDNSARNPHNPDAGQAVRFGFQSTDEMMIGFFDVAVGVDVDKGRFFVRN